MEEIEMRQNIKNMTCPWCKLKHTSLKSLNNHYFIELEDDEEENKRLKIHGGPNNKDITKFLKIVRYFIN